MKTNDIWSREETVVAFYVYCIIPFASSSKTNPIVIDYANMIGRSPSALNMKIGNIGRLDPELKKKDITGLTHGAKMEELVCGMNLIVIEKSLFMRLKKLLKS